MSTGNVFTATTITSLHIAAHRSGGMRFYEEHDAIVVPDGDSVEAHARQYNNIGWNTVKLVSEESSGRVITAFLQHQNSPGTRLVLVSGSGALSHKTIRILSRLAFQQFTDELRSNHPTLVHLPEQSINKADIKEEMYRNETGGVLKITWHREPLFPGDPESID